MLEKNVDTGQSWLINHTKHLKQFCFNMNLSYTSLYNHKNRICRWVKNKEFFKTKGFVLFNLGNDDKIFDGKDTKFKGISKELENNKGSKFWKFSHIDGSTFTYVGRLSNKCKELNLSMSILLNNKGKFIEKVSRKTVQK